MLIECVVPVEKFSDHVFKPGATHGKDRVFAALGYAREHSQLLTRIYADQAVANYLAGEYTLNRQDEHGQRITISIMLDGIAPSAEKTRVLRTGWMLTSDGRLRLLTPFSGYAARQGNEDAG